MTGSTEDDVSYRIGTVTALVLAVALVLCACSATENHLPKQDEPIATAASTHDPSGVVASQGDAGDANTFDEMVQEFRTTAAGLTVPAGVTLREPVDYDPGSFYEVGLGVGQARWAGFCAWEREWLAQDEKDAAAAAEALTQLRALQQTDTFTTYLDANGQELIREQIDQAALGNPTPMENDVEINC
jgi:hypothetical protein